MEQINVVVGWYMTETDKLVAINAMFTGISLLSTDDVAKEGRPKINPWPGQDCTWDLLVGSQESILPTVPTPTHIWNPTGNYFPYSHS